MDQRRGIKTPSLAIAGVALMGGAGASEALTGSGQRASERLDLVGLQALESLGHAEGDLLAIAQAF
jgi:hypothetical protein